MPDFNIVDRFLSGIAHHVTEDKSQHAALKQAIASEMFVADDVYTLVPLLSSVLFFSQIPGTDNSKLVKVLVWKRKPVILRNRFSLFWRYLLLRALMIVQ